MDTGYIETSIVRHATARPTAVAGVSVLQDQAKRWWSEKKADYRLVTSQFVIDEASLGDPDAAARRLEMLADIPISFPILLPDPRVEGIANKLVSRSLIPAKAKLDALHIASAAIAGVQYLLTQNCRHIANAHTLSRIYDLLESLGLPRLLICTPAEFLGDSNNDS